MKKLSVVVAVARDNAIGRNGDLLCHLPADLRHFKNLTSGHTVVMGRRTFDSLPKGALPNRRNIVITRNPAFSAPGTETAASIEALPGMIAPDETVFVLGGEQIYRQLLPLATELCLTRIEASFPDADTFFPVFDENEWEETWREAHEPDEKNAYPYTFLIYRRK